MIDLFFENEILGDTGVNTVSQNEETLYNQRLIQIKHDYETRRWIRAIITLVAVMVSFFAVISLMGIITHSQWVNLPQTSISSFSENITLDIFISGLKGLGIFSGTALLLWGLRTKI